MKLRNWIYLFALTALLSCKDEAKPCLAMSQVWGASLEGYENTFYQNVIQWANQFEVKFANGDTVPVIPNYSESTFFLQTDNQLNPTIYFRIKPSTNVDTINFYSHLSNWNDGSCSGTAYILDSIHYNGRVLNERHTFYYEQ